MMKVDLFKIRGQQPAADAAGCRKRAWITDLFGSLLLGGLLLASSEGGAAAVPNPKAIPAAREATLSATHTPNLVTTSALNPPAMNPVANPAAVVSGGKEVRFTVLTSGIVRLEWDAAGRFEDAASFVVVNRHLPVPKFTVRRDEGWLVLATERMEVRYREGSGRFTSENLTIRSPKGAAAAFEWRPGMRQLHNLKGTYRTLDRYDGDTHIDGHKLPLETGLLARDGWTLFDDSGSYLFDDSPWPWVAERRNPEAQDWYFLAYGHDYRSILGQFTRIAGKISLPPRYAFGNWWARYWCYSDDELRDLVAKFERYDLPLDVLVVDMDWHRTDSVRFRVKDEFGERKHWTGWTWNRKLFPAPEKFLAWTGSKGLRTNLNLHPASGVLAHEAVYPAFAERMGVDPATGRGIPYIGSDKRFMSALFDLVLEPMERMGVDFWWLDWQQALYDKKYSKLNNTWWLNYVFFSHMERNRQTRPLLYHRWGGLGNHRYQIGFSGDTYMTWKGLAFQPYFTSTASNVLYGYWSHDIGGHMYKPEMWGKPRGIDPELYTRWVQYGIWSPIFRPHSGKDHTINKEPWVFTGEWFDVQHEALDLRYRMVPYIYTAARQSYDTGISLCRPLYYHYPEEERAYGVPSQYLFGDDILVAAIGEPMQEGYSTVDVWLPGGTKWFEWDTGTLLEGGQTLRRSFNLTEYPVYVRAGSILPMYDSGVKNLSEQPSKICLAVFPGGDASGELYEDDGDDKLYDTRYARTRFSVRRKGKRLQVVIGASEGSYARMPAEREYEVRVYCSAVPRRVTVDGQPAAFDYKGDELRLDIPLAAASCRKQRRVEILYDDAAEDLCDGLTGKMKRLSRATEALKFRDAHLDLPDRLGQIVQTGRCIEYSPERFREVVSRFRAGWEKIPEELERMKLREKDRKWYLDMIRYEE